MIAPDTGDLEVGPCIPLPLETEAGKQLRASLIVREMVGHHAMDVHVLEHMLQDGPENLEHEPLPFRRVVDGIAKIAGLERPPDQVGEIADTQDLGPAKGVFSDLAVHDMGAALAGRGGAYGRSTPAIAANDNAWRTPPLWGVASSAPYMHDGRARDLYEAIRLHGGQAEQSARAFGALPAEKQRELQAFLLTLEAPRVE